MSKKLPKMLVGFLTLAALHASAADIDWRTMPMGVKHLSAKKAPANISAEQSWVNILTEDFSNATEGSEEIPDGTPITDDEYIVNDDYTIMQGWSGYGLYQAGGCLAIDGPGYGGFLNTPEISMKGLVRVSMRIKSLTRNCPVTLVLNRNGIANPKQIGAHDVVRIFDTDGWQNITFTVNNPYDDPAFMQFSRIHYRAEERGFLIDDISIDVLPDYIPPVTEVASGEFTTDGFGVRWVPSAFTDKYLVSLYEEVTTGDEDFSLIEDFSNWTANTNSQIDEFPVGWTLVSWPNHPNLVETDEGKSIAFGRHQEVLELPSGGGRIYDLSITFTNLLGSDPEAWGTVAGFEGWDGTQWQPITSFSTMGMDDGETFTMDLGKWEEEPADPYEMESNSFRGLYSKVRIVIESANYGAMLLVDKIEMKAFPNTVITKIVEDEVTIGNQKYYNGLRSDARYYVGVKAMTDSFISDETLHEAWGIATPTGLPVADVTPDSYTACWQQTSNAAAYLVTVFDAMRTDKDTNDFAILKEDFGGVSVGETDYNNPVDLGSKTEIVTLDEYTATKGWYGAGVIAVDGHIGCTACWFMPGMYAIMTPPLSLGANNGKYKVHLKVWGNEWSEINIASTTSVVTSQPFEESGIQNLVFEMEGGSYHDQIGIYTSDGQPFLIDEFEILQDLSEGELILNQIAAYEVVGEENCSRNIIHEAKPGMLRAYDVAAARVEFSRNVISDYSNPVVVDEAVNIESVDDGGNVTISKENGAVVINLPKESEVKIYNMAGNCIIKENAKVGITRFPLPSGIYVVKTENKVMKIIL